MRWWRNFRNRRRRIFQFDDGERIRRVDPLLIAQRLAIHPTYRPDHLIGAERGSPLDQRIVADAACDVFEVGRFDGGTGAGMTEAERIALMLDFDDYLLALKKNTRSTLTSPPSTGPTSTASSESITSDTSPFGLPDTDPPSARPKRSGLASSPG